MKNNQIILIKKQSESSQNITSINFTDLLNQFANIESLLMFVFFLILFIISQTTKNGKGKLTSGRKAGVWEKLNATNEALKQIKAKKHQPVTLWSGTPNYWLGKRYKSLSSKIQTLLGASPTVWFPNCERGTLVIGAPGSGKTFSVIDRMIESAFNQGFSVICYDKKGEQIKLHAPLAARYGYDIQVFAPGENYSGVINPLDFMRDAQDAVMAGEIGQVIIRNSSYTEGKGNDFFEKAGAMMAKGLVQLAKSSEYPDLGMVYAIIQLPDLVKRIDYAVHLPDNHPQKINRWIATSFSQLLSSKNAEKTVAGIKATAEATYSAFIQKDLLRAFIGKSTIPLRLDGKQAIFFKLDDERRSIVGPLLASAIHLCVVANLSKPRSNPFVYSLDEFPSLKLDRIVNWVNEYRSNGGVPIIGIQSLNQLYDTYGEQKGNAIASALSTHILFNPGDYNTADKYSKRYGETEIKLKNRSTGKSLGIQHTRSINWNEQIYKKPLISADEILRFPQGKCVITSPAYSSKEEALFPYPIKIPIRKQDIKRQEESMAMWQTKIRPQLEKRAKIHRIDVKTNQEVNLDLELEKRIQTAFQMLPHPDELQGKINQQQKLTSSDAINTKVVSNYREMLAEADVNFFNSD